MLKFFFIVETKSLTSDVMHKSQPFETLAEATAEARKIAMRHRRTCRVVRVDLNPDDEVWFCCFKNLKGETDCSCSSEPSTLGACDPGCSCQDEQLASYFCSTCQGRGCCLPNECLCADAYEWETSEVY